MMPPYRQFLLARVHSLLGVIPLGVFLGEHFFVNSFSHKGPDAFNAGVDMLRGLPYLDFLEWGLIFLPLLFHGLLGLVLIWRGSVNVQSCSYARNWLYVFQRLTAPVVLVFLFIHIVTLRYDWWGVAPAGGHPDFYDLVSRLFNNPWMVAFYVVGVLATCFHFANGLSTFCMTWGLTIGRNSQRIVGYACAAFGVGLAAMALWAIVGFKGSGTLDQLIEERSVQRPASERVAMPFESQRQYF